MTVNAWLDIHVDILKGRKVRVVESATNRGIGDMLMYYLQREVKRVKVTSKFVFLYV